MLSVSGYLLEGAFFVYLIATILSWVSFSTKKKEDNSSPKWQLVTILISIFGLILQIGYFITRWIAVDHIPVSNMFEFTTLFGMMLVFAYILLYFFYRTIILGLFALPTALSIIAFASVFPKEASPLVPSLQSYWLNIHVTTAALGEGILAISFIAGLAYLLKMVDQSKKSIKTFLIEFIFYAMISTFSFAIVAFFFNTISYETTFKWNDTKGQELTVKYNMLPIVGPNGSSIVDGSYDYKPIIEVPKWMKGVNASRKLNSLIWSLSLGLVIYLLIRLFIRKRIGKVIQPLLKNIKPSLLDEINNRSVIIGFPIFTLGALVFAMIWAQEAWTRFWGWDPKEVWALITWLFYAAYLHLRLGRGWEGEKSAWLAVIGFVIIMFNLVVVNLVIAGLHSYA